MTGHGSYYVPEKSALPIIMAIGLFCLGYGSLNLLHAHLIGPIIFLTGCAIVAICMFFWFRAVINEHSAGLHDAQMERSYRWGMVWFVFSEVCFFGIFFFALFYIRWFTVPALGGIGGYENSVLTRMRQDIFVNLSAKKHNT